MIKGKTPEEIRKTFNIKNDFTEEEEAQVAIMSITSLPQHEKVFYKLCKLNLIYNLFINMIKKINSFYNV